MALCASEIGILRSLLDLLRAQGCRRPRVLSLGYPDMLVTADSLADVGLALDYRSLPKIAPDRSRIIWQQHGRPALTDTPMIEARGLFDRLGANIFITDHVKTDREDAAFDLNRPIRFWRSFGRFDLVIDPGTIEHCFNIAQAFANIDRLLTPGGFVFHQACAAFPNHGFWSISPTTFFDFYQPRGFALGYPKRTVRALDSHGFVVEFATLDPFAPIPQAQGPMIVRYVFRKPVSPVSRSTGYPIQRCYSNMSREIVMTEFWADGSERARAGTSDAF